MPGTLGQGTGSITQKAQPDFVTARLTGAFCSQFDMNELPSHKYETLPIKQGHLPGYAGHVPGSRDAIAQRRPQAALHTANHMATASTTSKGSPSFTDMSLVDLRPEQRSMAKVYMYAEGAKSNFLKFPTDKTFDHRRS